MKSREKDMRSIAGMEEKIEEQGKQEEEQEQEKQEY